MLVPEGWSQVAVDILAQKYFRRKGIDPAGNGERDARQVFHRLAGCWRHWGEQHGYFSTPEDGQAFYDELVYMLANQMCAPNSPQWFNTGLHWAYGISGPAQGHSYVDPADGQLKHSTSAYERPQPHACFIQSVEDDLVNPGGIMDLWTREARIFKYGSGTGTNFSKVRGADEALSGGGRSSGLMSFLAVGDKAAGAIKSGGTHPPGRQDGVPGPGPPGHRGLHRLEGQRGAQGGHAGRRQPAARQALERPVRGGRGFHHTGIPTPRPTRSCAGPSARPRPTGWPRPSCPSA